MSQVVTPSPQPVCALPMTTQQSVHHDSTPPPQQINGSNSPSSVDQHVEHELDEPTTEFRAADAANQPIERELDAATTEMRAVNVDGDSTNFQ
ncbi:hypothetical protein V6N11_050313 [Hibiscus sabdariffa]|uniref:Uncharacterized protein n=1 Tax=Hibiscus sabdariffa TaxID=183260 RepID=A0ABR2T9G2_9ROSI